MNYSKCSAHAVSLLVALPLMLTSLQAQESVVPLRNWDSARYWHPNELEREAAVKPVPQGQPPVKAGVNLSFVAMTPCRLVDTRGGTAGFDGISPFSGPSIAASATVTFPVKSANSNTTPAPCGVIPSIAAAYSLNITVIPHAGAAVAFVTVWPASISQPVVSTLNDTQGKVVANAAIIPAGTPNGGISLFNYGPAIIDVVIDMNGYFATPTDLNGNTALGAATLANNTTGIDNTANGDAALNGNIGGHDNTASGYQALLDNTSGIFNTATGSNALAENVGGQGNTVSGADSMQHNTSGSLNTAIGYQALPANIAGSNNLALGSYALQNNLASNNTATGSEALQDNTTGSGNAAHGYQALMMNLTGMNNTAGGYQALQNNLASNNTATGYQALQDNTTGSGNIANGYQALLTNVAGMNNTAGGYQALQNNLASNNTATGYQALQDNTTGTGNMANGYQALQVNLIGVSNTASGYQALQDNLADGNTATGYFALQVNTTGTGNTASGLGALGSNISGNGNTAFGYNALQLNTSGGNNIAIGQIAASAAPITNTDSIYIGASGTGTDVSGTIQIGTQAVGTGGTIQIGSAQAGGTFIAGISGATAASGLEVLVTSSGQLGTVLSSSRFKEEITDMGDSSSRLLQLRPVSFFYKPQFDDGSHLPQYGLIAEEVAKVYPEMVAYDNHGEILSIKYQLLAPMLLNELQKQAQQNLQQARQLRSLEDRLAALEGATAAGPQPVH